MVPQAGPSRCLLAVALDESYLHGMPKKAAAPKTKKIVAIKKKAASPPKRKRGSSRGFLAGTYVASPHWTPEWLKMIQQAGSSSKLAKALATTVQSLIRWSRGDVPPNEVSLAKIKKYCEAYGLRAPKF